VLNSGAVDFSWTDEQTASRKKLVEFAQTQLNDRVVERDLKAEFDLSGWKKCGEFGIPGLPIPTEYGGSGSDILTTIYLLEGLGYGCTDGGLTLAINAHMWGCEIPILSFGTKQQKELYLPRLCSGKWIGALAVAERDAGSDTNNIQTVAEPRGDHYVLNGTKMFVTNGPVADLLVVLAKCSQGEDDQLTAFLVEKSFPGYSCEETIDKMGSRTSPMGELCFNDCLVPSENVLGKTGAGTSVFRQAMEWERAFILASAVGCMERQLDTCVRYVRKRRQFGKPIGKFQLVASKLVDLKMRLETARLLLYKVGWLKEQGKPMFMEASLAKLYISEAWVESSLDTIQVHGGYGYLTDSELERTLRDSVGSRIYSGTSEVQRLIISKMMGL
jgi:alkylation response protein AidB-like acyl-CoA dehydrogenase